MECSELIELFGMAAIFVATLMLNLAFLRLNPSFVLRDSRVLAPVSPEDTSLVDALNKLMSEDLAYTNHDLRIADLAASLRVPEYQLRRTINRNLGHQNFNQFVNGYRVEEAARRLIDEPRAPCLLSRWTSVFDRSRHSIPRFGLITRRRRQTTERAAGGFLEKLSDFEIRQQLQ